MTKKTLAIFLVSVLVFAVLTSVYVYSKKTGFDLNLLGGLSLIGINPSPSPVATTLTINPQTFLNLNPNAYWSLDEDGADPVNKSGKVRDSKPNDSWGDNYGSNTHPLAAGNGAPCVMGRCLNFRNNSIATFSYAGFNSRHLPTMTFSFWSRLINGSSDYPQDIITVRKSDASTVTAGFRIMYRNNGALLFRVYDPVNPSAANFREISMAVPYALYDSSTLPPWINIVAVFDNGYMKLYLNGEKKAETNSGYAEVSWALSQAGLSVGTAGFNGYLDEVAFWAKALKNCEISTHNPQNVSVSVLANVAAGTETTITAKYTDPKGTNDINYVHLLVNSTVSGRYALYTRFYQGRLYLRDNPNLQWLGGCLPLPGTSQTIENDYVKLSCQTTVQKTGNDLIINWKVSFKPTFLGLKNAYLFAVDKNGCSDGWDKLASFTIR